MTSEEDQGLLTGVIVSSPSRIPGQKGRKNGEMLTHDGCRQPLVCMCLWELTLLGSNWMLPSHDPFHLDDCPLGGEMHCDWAGFCVKMIIPCPKFCPFSLWPLPSMTRGTSVKGLHGAEGGLAVVKQLFG